jgi:hypothetical protein
MQSIMNEKSHTNIHDYKIVTERSPKDRKMIKVEIAAEK